ncbi:DUF2726 domain-containing protein [Acetobacter okinawensis]|nr:DUF2726 domain-containing protein [Acetobacter okinawensis]
MLTHQNITMFVNWPWLWPAVVAMGTVLGSLVAYDAALSKRRFTSNSVALVGSLRRDRLLSEWERRTLLFLKHHVRSGYHICPQVRLADMVQSSASTRKALILALNGVQRKSVDFVLVSEESGQAVLAIELDDKTHDKPHRQKRDMYVNAVFRQIDIPLIRVRPGQKIHLPVELSRDKGLENESYKKNQSKD